MTRRWLRFFSVAAATVLLSSCYGTKIFKGPINSEHAALSARIAGLYEEWESVHGEAT